MTGYPPQGPGFIESMIDTDVATHAALIATHGVSEVADAADLTTHKTDTSTHGVGEVADAADLTTHAADTSTHGVGTVADTADLTTHEADTSTHGVGEIADAADLTTHIADASTHGVTGDILGTEDKDVASGILGLASDLTIGHAFDKIASANLRNYHDAEVTASTSSKVYQTKKTVTFLNGIKGQIRIKFDKKRVSGADWCYARVMKNESSVIVAEVQFNNAVYDTVSTDVTEDFAAGDTIDLQICTATGGSVVAAENFRFYYDNDDFVAVPGVNS